MTNKKIDIGKYIAPAIGKILEAQPNVKIKDKQQYKLSMKVWFEIRDDKIIALNLDEINFKEFSKKIIVNGN